jgi:sugar lactone lactonase YvrE
MKLLKLHSVQTPSLLTVSLAAMLLAACSSNDALTATNPPPSNQVARDATHFNSARQLLYVSNKESSVINIYSVPGYSKVGRISSGLDFPEGIATDTNGNLYVANTDGDAVTIYKPGTTSPDRTLIDSHGPDDVAVATNGYVFTGDQAGGVDVYAPGQTNPSTRLTNSGISIVRGVAVDASNNVYATGTNASSKGVVIEYTDMSGGGTNLGLQDLESPLGVLIDKNNNVVVSDVGANEIFIYPQGKTSPSSEISVSGPHRSAVNQQENLIYVPQGPAGTEVLDYPSGARVTSVSTGFASGTALSPAPPP